ncbi:hypothetical protein Btru_002398 [Bulinus truncatus]|nr:hypothetical protein Btru_002398 [Bulinus truncatus]
MKHIMGWPSFIQRFFPLLLSLLTFPSRQLLVTSETMDVKLFDHFQEPYHRRHVGVLKIDLLESGTSTLWVRWNLLNLTSTDSFFESTVMCETAGGRIVSDKLPSSANMFQFHHLDSDTQYLVCVYLLEKSNTTNTSILHYSCESFRTIPTVRADSVAGVIMAVGYLASMVGMGYLAWWRKSVKIKRRREKKEEEEKESTKLNGQRDRGEGQKLTQGQKLSRNAVSYGTDGEVDSLNKGMATCSAVGCMKFSKPEENVIQYNAEEREISF